MPFKDTFWWDLVKSIGLPVILFMSGYLLNVIIENRKESKRLKNIEEYFKTLVDLEYQVAIEQAIHYENCAERLSCVDERKISVSKVIGHPEKSLNDINHSDLYKIFINGANIDESARNFNILLAKLNYIDNNINLVTVNLEGFELAVNQLDKEWHETGKLLTSSLSKIANTRDIKTALNSKDQYIRKIGQVIDFTYSTPNEQQTRTATYNNVVKSLIQFINIDAHIDDPRNKQYLSYLVTLEVIYNQYQDLYSRRRESCFQSAKNLRESANEIKRIATKL